MEAEAMREKRARIIKADAELEASKKPSLFTWQEAFLSFCKERKPLPIRPRPERSSRVCSGWRSLMRPSAATAASSFRVAPSGPRERDLDFGAKSFLKPMKRVLISHLELVENSPRRPRSSPTIGRRGPAHFDDSLRLTHALEDKSRAQARSLSVRVQFADTGCNAGVANLQ